MEEKLVMYLAPFGGFVVAFVCLLYATILRSIRPMKWICLVGAFCGLAYEGLIFTALSGIGRATGGGDDGSTIPAIGFLIGIIWTILLFIRTSAEKKESDN